MFLFQRSRYRCGPLLSDDLTKNEVEQLFESTKKKFYAPGKRDGSI